MKTYRLYKRERNNQRINAENYTLLGAIEKNYNIIIAFLEGLIVAPKLFYILGAPILFSPIVIKHQN